MSQHEDREIEAFLKGFDAALAAEDRSDKTKSAYLSDVNQFIAVAGNPSGWTTGDIEAYKRQMVSKRLAASSINRKLTALHQFVEYLNVSGMKVMVSVRLIKVQKMEMLGEVITPENIEKMVAIANERKDNLAAAIFMGLGKTGCRVSELLQWQIKDIGRPVITVIGKGSKLRDLLPPDYLKYYLTDLIGERENPDDPIFINRYKGKALTRQRVDQIIKHYAKMAKVNRDRAHAHSFRHQYGQKLTDDGVKIEDVAELLGHSNINTTKIYSRSTRKKLKSHINKM